MEEDIAEDNYPKPFAFILGDIDAFLQKQDQVDIVNSIYNIKESKDEVSEDIWKSYFLAKIPLGGMSRFFFNLSCSLSANRKRY
jgi:hypothetical protein